MSIKERFRRADWLRELHGVLICGLALVGVGLTVTVGVAMYGPLTFDVPSDLVATTDSLTGLRPGASLDSQGFVGISVQHPSAWQATLGVLATVPTGLLVLAMLAMLLRVVRHARRDDPFTVVTVSQLRLLGTLVIGGGALAWVVESVARVTLVGTVATAGWGGTITLIEPMMWGLVGFGYLAIAEVFNHGRAMRAELSEVI